LDCIKIKREERVRAKKLAQSTAGSALESDVQQQILASNVVAASSNGVKTFTPGESTDGTTVVTLFSAEEKETIRNLLANANSVQEIEEIETAVRNGILPEGLVQRHKQPRTTMSEDHNTDNDDQTNENDDIDASGARKRQKVT
jgi:hypothetical protein